MDALERHRQRENRLHAYTMAVLDDVAGMELHEAEEVMHRALQSIRLHPDYKEQ